MECDFSIPQELTWTSKQVQMTYGKEELYVYTDQQGKTNASFVLLNIKHP